MTTTEMKRALLGRGIRQLRLHMKWTQEQFGKEIERYAGCHRDGAVWRRVISQWETSTNAPQPRYRLILARIAKSHARDDLAIIFLASARHWRVVMDCWRLIGVQKEYDERAGPGEAVA
jgi:transcriptional regulator with XRE-family HTH domain